MNYQQETSYPTGNEPVKDNILNPSSGDSPSLVYIGQSSAFKPWSKRQKRLYQRLLSFEKEALGRGCQLFRVDLTSAREGDNKSLVRGFQELRRRIEKTFGYYIEYFKVETSEGHGVYHMVWAINANRAVWIPQEWLSERWGEIHGAKIVYIKRMKKDKHTVRNVGRYFAVQYLAGQSSFVRMSWSWWRARLAIGKGWSFLKTQMMRGFDISTWQGRSPFNKTLTYRDMLVAWDEILSRGWYRIANATIFISGRSLDIAFE